MTAKPPQVRSLAQRRSDVQQKLASEQDAWVASADASGAAHLVPLSFAWVGGRVVLATPGSSRTARNLRRAGWVRLALGPTRDVVIVEGTLYEQATNADPRLAEQHAAAVGFDAREEPGYVFFIVTPQRIQAWRTPAELPGRDVMRDGIWLEE